jgi:hypothetical protein
LERCQPLAVFMRLLLPHVVVALQQHAAPLHYLRKLKVHFAAQKLRDCQPRQDVHCQLVFFLGAIQGPHLQLGEQRLPSCWIIFRLCRLSSLGPHP